MWTRSRTKASCEQGADLAQAQEEVEVGCEDELLNLGLPRRFERLNCIAIKT